MLHKSFVVPKAAREGILPPPSRLCPALKEGTEAVFGGLERLEMDNHVPGSEPWHVRGSRCAAYHVYE